MRRAARPRRALGLTSLIDVIFLLLLFFMLSSTFSRFTELQLVAGGPGGGAASDARPRLLRLTTQGLRIDGADISDPVPALTGEAAVLVTMDPEVTSQSLVSLLAKLQDVDGLAVTVRP